MSEQNVGFHEAADIFPAMSDDEFEAFKKDIAENGLQTPIVTTEDGYILDGRHRWRACMETETEPRYQVHAGNPWTYVISANLHRRHLNSSQKSMVAARVAVRQPGQRGHIPGSRRDQKLTGSGKHLGDHLPPSQGQLAEQLGIGHTSITKARNVVKGGIPELASVVDDGTVKVETAARISRLDEDAQREFVKRVRSGERPAKVAPPSKPPIERDSIRPPRTQNRNVLSTPHIQSLGSAMVGIEVSFRDVTALDDGIDPQLVKRTFGEIAKGVKVINRIRRLLATRLQEDKE